MTTERASLYAFWFSVATNALCVVVNLGTMAMTLRRTGNAVGAGAGVALNSAVLVAIITARQWLTNQITEHTARLRELTAQASMSEAMVEKLRAAESISLSGGFASDDTDKPRRH